MLHLVLEVIAYAADEAEDTAGRRCAVTLHNDGSVSAADNGRGTDTRYDAQGRPIRKPVMATKDLRYFDFPDAQLLPDGHARRGMSVVAALSEWLIHTNYRHDGRGPNATNTACPLLTCSPYRATARQAPPCVSCPTRH